MNNGFQISWQPRGYSLQPYKDIWYGYYPEKDRWVIANTNRADNVSMGQYDSRYRIDQAIDLFREQMKRARGTGGFGFFSRQDVIIVPEK